MTAANTVAEWKKSENILVEDNGSKDELKQTFPYGESQIAGSIQQALDQLQKERGGKEVDQ